MRSPTWLPGQRQRTTRCQPAVLSFLVACPAIASSKISQLGKSVAIGATNERPGTMFEVITDSTTIAQPGQGPAAIFGQATGNVDLTVGVAGFATAESGNVFGVAGVTFSPAGQGVTGNNTSPVGGGGGGIFGVTSASSGFSFGSWGAAIGTSGAVIGVLGTTTSPQGDGGRFVGVRGDDGTISRGDVGPTGAGTEFTVFRVDGDGTVFANGGFRPHGADFAEAMLVSGDRARYAPGDLLVIDVSGRRRLTLSQTSYSSLVAGIYSTKPGVVASQHGVGDPVSASEVPLAIVGIVPCKVTAENGPIASGDLLVTSSTPGHAMKGTDRGRMLGAVVGKALEPMQKETGVIQVLVTLQ